MITRRLGTASLLHLVEERARIEFGGAITLFRFTSGWKGGFETVDLDTGFRGPDPRLRGGRRDVQALQAFPTVEEVLADMLITGRSCRP